MSLVRHVEDDRYFGRAVKALVVAIVVAVVGFAAYYYLDRYHASSTTVVDREIARGQEMVRNDPSNTATRMALANLYLRKSAWSDAAAQYSEVLKAEEKNTSALGGLGIALFRQNKLKESQAAFEQVISLTPDDTPAYRTPAMATVFYFLGKIYASQNDPVKAEAQLAHSLSINKGDADTIFALGDAVAQQNRYQEAIGLYETAIAYVPDFAEAYAALAKTYAAAGMPAEASYAAAMGDYCKGNYDSAISRLQAVVQAKPDLAEAYYGLGASYDKKGTSAKAIEAYQKTLELQPDYEAARVSMIRLGAKPPANSVAPTGHQSQTSN